MIACEQSEFRPPNPARSMRLSVVVPVHDGGDQLRRCLLGLAASLRAADEIIVVDDGSSDGSRETTIALGARVLRTEAGPRGPAYARNRGAAAATGDILVFVDADVVVHADTLGRMEAVFAAEPEISALFGSYDDNPPETGLASRYKNLQHHYVHQHGDRDAGTFWAGCGAIRRSTFLAVGGFDESYRQPSIEDIELGVRLRQAGHRIRLCPEVQATHLKRWTLSSLWRTDICARALPWTRLVLRLPRVPSDLNLNWKSRAAALAAWTSVTLGIILTAGVLAGAEGWLVWSAVFMLASAGATVLLNVDLYRFFFGHGGASFAMGALWLHWTYLLYSSAVFAALWVRHRLRRRTRPSRA
jgi:GT2 family glycosyltransferase